MARRAAVLYLAWEHGAARANQILRGLPLAGFVRVYAPCDLARVRAIVAYQQGRLGCPMTDAGGVYAV